MRVVVDSLGTILQQVDYLPYGEKCINNTLISGENDYLYGGKEFQAPVFNIPWYDSQARIQTTDGIFVSLDPQCEKYYSISPYAYCAGNPVNVVDPIGLSPIYDENGHFLGTDDEGLTGKYIVMNNRNFIQGMSHADAFNNNVSNLNDDVVNAIETHYNGLPTRPDYDGYLTINEGIKWAKEHPDALKKPTPDNTLYLNAEKLDFGFLDTDYFPEEGVATPVELFTEKRIRAMFTKPISPFFLTTVYALGYVNLVLENREQKTVSVVNDNATDYDWNNGGSLMRRVSIKTHTFIHGIDPSKHGFKTYYYGHAKLLQ